MHRTTIGALLALACALPVAADNVTLTWTNPATWFDGTPLGPTDLKWANVYCGSAGGTNYEWVASVDVSTGTHAYTFQTTTAITCAVSFVAMTTLTQAEIDAGSTSYPIESALSPSVTFTPARVPESSVVTGVIQGPTPMHCTTTTACAVDPPVAIDASVRSP